MPSKNKAVVAMELGKGAALREAFEKASNKKAVLAALAKSAINNRVDKRIGAALVAAWDVILAQPFDEAVKDLLPAMAIGAVHQRHARKKDTGAMVAKLTPLVAKNYFEAELIGAWAGGLSHRKKYAEALDLIEIAIACPSMHEWQHYGLALWVIQESNTKIPLDHARARRFLDACLSHGKKRPEILHNAACVFAELGDTTGVAAQIRALEASNYAAIETAKKECAELLRSG